MVLVVPSRSGNRICKGYRVFSAEPLPEAMEAAEVRALGRRGVGVPLVVSSSVDAEPPLWSKSATPLSRLSHLSRT